MVIFQFTPPSFLVNYISPFTSVLRSRASQILCMATDGCRSQPWLACRPTSRASYWRCSRTLTLLFRFSFQVDGHVHLQSWDVSVYSLWLLLDISESFSLSPNCTGIRHRSSWKLYSKFASCFRTRLSAFHIHIVNIHTFTQWEFLSRHVTNRNNHNHYT